jgi:hypothetical protein
VCTVSSSPAKIVAIRPKIHPKSQEVPFEIATFTWQNWDVILGRSRFSSSDLAVESYVGMCQGFMLRARRETSLGL